MRQAIAIDGPAGSGKSTVAKRLAEELGMMYLDTGAIYRAITLAVLERNISPTDFSKIRELLSEIHLTISDDGISLNGKNVSSLIRSKDVTAAVSDVCSDATVRHFATSIERKIAGERPSILDGRDIGTVVLPDARLKIFLTASPEVRAKRRLHDEKNTSEESYEEILEAIKRRDTIDSTRAVDPLRQAEDAIYLDSSDMSIDQTVEAILDLWRRQ